MNFSTKIKSYVCNMIQMKGNCCQYSRYTIYLNQNFKYEYEYLTVFRILVSNQKRSKQSKPMIINHIVNLSATNNEQRTTNKHSNHNRDAPITANCWFEIPTLSSWKSKKRKKTAHKIEKKQPKKQYNTNERTEKKATVFKIRRID